jgi:replicative DNA helicase
MYGKIPPHSEEAERAVIGACLIDEDASLSIVSTLKPEMFYNPKHQHIYAVIFEYGQKGKWADLVITTSELRKRGLLDDVGGAVYITELSSVVSTALRVEEHALIIKQNYILRQHIAFSDKLMNMAFDDDVESVNEFAENEVFKITSQSQTKEPKRIDKCVDEVLRNVSKIINNPHELIGIPSGFKNVDRITGGWQRTNFIIIAARPRVGKTSIGLTLVQNAALMGHPVAFFSLEMSEIELAGRLLSNVSGYTNMEIRGGRIDYNKLVTTSENIARLPLLIDDTAQISISELRSKIKKLIIKDRIEMVVIDYLQLMVGSGDNREQEVSSISRGLKAIAKEFNIPVIACAQLNRSQEARADKRPQLGDLRESGSLESDADVVVLLYRPELDRIKSINLNGNELDTEGLIVLDIAKNRHGASWSLPLYHNDPLTQFAESREDVGITLF